jgi:hypothetical protein
MGQLTLASQAIFERHIGVESKETVVHSAITSAASAADKHMLPDLLHGGRERCGETRVIKDRPRRFMRLHPKPRI